MSATSSSPNTKDVNDKQFARSTDVLSEKDFIILYPSSDNDGGLAQAILALYYLPPQFKLKVLSDTTVSDNDNAPFQGHEAVRQRITVAPEHNVHNRADAFSHIDAVLYDERVPVQSQSTAAPHVIISSTQGSFSEVNGSFTVSAGSPEALASAMLRIAKAS